MFKALLTTIFAIGAITGSIVVGKSLIEEAPIIKMPKIKKAENIRELLTNKGHAILNTKDESDNKKWEDLIKKYIALKDETEVKKIKELEFSSTETEIKKEDIAKLKNKCNELLETKISEDESFKLAEANTISWCTDINSKVINVG